jgi:hypothetical protein
MHAGEEYGSPVSCRPASSEKDAAALGDSSLHDTFSFCDMKQEIKALCDSRPSGGAATLVIEIGFCSNSCPATPLREMLLKGGSSVFVVNPLERSSHIKKRLLARQPMLVSKIGNLRVVKDGLLTFAATLRKELEGHAD